MFDRITFDPRVMGGRACIRGMRITGGDGRRADCRRRTTDEVLSAYPDLEADDVRQALAFQSSVV